MNSVFSYHREKKMQHWRAAFCLLPSGVHCYLSNNVSSSLTARPITSTIAIAKAALNSFFFLPQGSSEVSP